MWVWRGIVSGGTALHVQIFWDTVAAMPKRQPRASEPELDLAACRALSVSWDLQLRAERKSPETLKSYGAGLRGYLGWCETQALEPLVKESLNGWTISLLESGQAPATVVSRQLAVRRFTAWLEAESEISADPFLGVRAPKIDVEVVDPLTDAEVRAMLAQCEVQRGVDPKVVFRRRRDEAIIRLMYETGTRASEVVNVELEDVDLVKGLVVVRRGKGGKGRVVPIGPEVVRAVDRYMRLRRTHRLAGSAQLWLGDRGKAFTYQALYKTLVRRATDAGVSGFHPHRLRHTMADRWLDAGGSESGLMAVAGWSRPDMLMRYTKARATARAVEEARRLGIGEL